MLRQKLSDFPNILAEWDYSKNDIENPPLISARSLVKYYWICPKGHPSYLATPDKRTSRNDGCPICGQKKALQNRKHKQ